MSRHQRCSVIWRFFVAQFNMQTDYSWFLSAFAFLALGVISLLRKQKAFAFKTGKQVIGLDTWDIPGIIRASSPEDALAHAEVLLP